MISMDPKPLTPRVDLCLSLRAIRLSVCYVNELLLLRKCVLLICQCGSAQSDYEHRTKNFTLMWSQLRRLTNLLPKSNATASV